MKIKVFILSILFGICSAQTADPKIVCYLQGSSFNEGFTLKNSDDIPCTHIIFSRAAFRVMSDGIEIQEKDEAGLEEVLLLRNSTQRFKVLIQVGDDNDNEKYSVMTSTPSNRIKFIRSIIELLNTYGFDGVDLHWMHPVNKPEEKTNYLSFGQELKKAFAEEAKLSGNPVKIISMIIPNLLDLIKPGYNIMVLQSRSVDFFCLPAYNFMSNDSPLEDHHSPISSPKTLIKKQKESSAEFMARLYLRVGLLQRKLVLGIPLFGRKYTLTKDNSTVIENSTTTVPYNQLCNLKEDGWTTWSNDLKGKFAYKDSQVISYDDKESVEEKADLASKLNIGGIMFWSLEMDDWNRDCPTSTSNDNESNAINNEKWPLIRAAKRILERNRLNYLGSLLEDNNKFLYSAPATVPVLAGLNINREPGNEKNSNDKNFQYVSSSTYSNSSNSSNEEEEGEASPFNAPVVASYGPPQSSQQYIPPQSQPLSYQPDLLSRFKLIEAGKDIVIEESQIQFNENHFYRPPPP